MSWVRRGRIDADSWLAEDVPLGETQELYRVEIAATDGAIKRSVSRNEPNFHYDESLIAQDFAAEETEFDLAVCQVGSIGPGLVAKARFPLP